jgi:hypothetical protein
VAAVAAIRRHWSDVSWHGLRASSGRISASRRSGRGRPR